MHRNTWSNEPSRFVSNLLEHQEFFRLINSLTHSPVSDTETGPALSPPRVLLKMALRTIDPVENRRRMLAGELYYSFTPDLVADRRRCKVNCTQYNLHSTSGEAPRRQLVELWKK